MSSVSPRLRVRSLLRPLVLVRVTTMALDSLVRRSPSISNLEGTAAIYAEGKRKQLSVLVHETGIVIILYSVSFY